MKNKIEFFKDVKKNKKKKDKDAMDLAKDALMLAGGVAVLGAAVTLLD